MTGEQRSLEILLLLFRYGSTTCVIFYEYFKTLITSIFGAEGILTLILAFY